MPIVLSTPPYQQFYDANGNPLSGGFVYTYVAGTLTPTATYTDQSGGTPCANPIVLDSAGRGEFWLDNGVSYKYIVKDNLNNTIKTIDNVTPFSSSTGLAVLGSIATNTIVGNNTGSTATPTALTVAQVKTMLGIPNGLVYLGQATASTSATVSLNSLIVSTYDDYVIEIDNLVPASASSLFMKLSANNGSTYLTANNTNSIVNDGAATTYVRDTDATVMTLTSTDIYTNGAYGTCSAHIFLRNVNTATTAQWFTRWSTGNNTAAITAPKTSNGGGTPNRGASNVVNAVQFLMSTGNISTGTFRIYGVQKS